MKIPKFFINLAKIILNPTTTECMRKFEYAEDGIITLHTCNFREDKRFIEARASGKKNVTKIYDIDWRLHTALWVAEQCSHLQGDFVECGVDEAFLTGAIVKYIDFNKLNKKFYLLDTFDGIPIEYINKEEMAIRGIDGDYKNTLEQVKTKFKDFKNVIIIKGKVPKTLSKVKSKKIAYLSIDMNNSFPEIKAAEYFWDKLVEGGMILLDDYAFNRSYEIQRKAFDKFAAKKGVQVLTLATGQGLIIKR